MSHPITDDSWKTPQLRAAEADLRAAVEHGRQALARARQFRAQIRPSRVSDEDIRQLDQAAHAPDAPRELRELAERIDRGELSWRQIVDGEAIDDPGVRAAFEGQLDRLAQVYRKFEEGYSLEDVLESETGTRYRAGRREDGEDREDAADEGGGTVLKHSSW